MDLLNKTINELKTLLETKQISAYELNKFYLDRIKNIDTKIDSYLYLNESILDEAKIIDEKRARGEKLPEYAGIPIAIKDNMVTKGMPTTCASKILENFDSPYNATVVELLKEKGFLILGKLNMDEFAMGSSCENSYYKKTKNPWDLERVPGGSSGGSAAAVAARLAPATLGSDTGGSIRQPASLCNVCGLKPTYGRVSRYGLVAFASSLDQIGPLTHNVEDSALLLSIIGKHDEKDSTSAKFESKDYTANLNKDIKGLKIGVPKEFFGEGIQPEVKEKVLEAIKQFESLGCEIKEISLPHTEYAVAVYYIIATAEASSNLARYDGVRYGFRAEAEGLIDMYEKTRSIGFGDEVKRRIMLGTYVLSAGYYDAYYLKAQKVRTLIKNDYLNAFKEVDVIITPTSPTTAFKIGEKSSDPLQMYLSDIYTISLNLFGGCGISIPCGFDNNNLPIGLQIMGNYFEEEKVLNLAHKFQQITDFHKKLPSIAS
ncbi:aspartyl-tRNA(Asn)/glutamyl-tRNA (Gln) amidotransferase subunit A [Deferribacter desulfuricans SSM1]|uniref:Glutamyl-tRNA(Gln) amidotransferase subunit A n=1 Tax=Deferribacter desulfuricans (strain DSM 14783 / JCM 11476 / NBRC 101012 / SSM1) TaxID=639282 RepID=D3P9L2_DEFDS|nr:Asp-tRNA(Asn)/Glu-tRNA(Gln) amidotransferase subunit GatA [Deferribacter desulfuricans]BAI81402.1 aspartyl-tRNA(Asn)/glutamyl-tRNA (Gln) amidotransferase subunit A [Deferribacter desulfuricans SSM1]